MKPAKFDYFAPTTLDETLELLSQHGPDAKALAGGQSLMPFDESAAGAACGGY